MALKIRLRLPQAAQAGTASTLHHDPQRAFSQPQYLRHTGDRSHGVEVLFRWLFHADLPLCHQKDLLSGLHGDLQRLNGNAALYVKGEICMWKYRQAPKGQYGNIQSIGFHSSLLSGE